MKICLQTNLFTQKTNILYKKGSNCFAKNNLNEKAYQFLEPLKFAMSLT